MYYSEAMLRVLPAALIPLHALVALTSRFSGLPVVSQTYSPRYTSSHPFPNFHPSSYLVYALQTTNAPSPRPSS